MTQNEIAYWANVEQKRHNQAQEAETTRANLAKEKENFRSNKSSEAINAYKAKTDRVGTFVKGFNDTSKGVLDWTKMFNQRVGDILGGIGDLLF